jgi:hypothetical protein
MTVKLRYVLYTTLAMMDAILPGGTAAYNNYRYLMEILISGNLITVYQV